LDVYIDSREAMATKWVNVRVSKDVMDRLEAMRSVMKRTNVEGRTAYQEHEGLGIISNNVVIKRLLDELESHQSRSRR
jgi:histidine ammonia-lyase